MAKKSLFKRIKKKIRKLLGIQKPAKEPKRNYKYYASAPVERYEEELKLWYERKMGTPLDLENPKTFNEKVQWLKLYDATPLKTRLADKYLVRDWVKEKIGEEYLVPLLGVWDRFEDIDFDALPEKFVLKTNHASRTVMIVTDKSKFDREDAAAKFSKWLDRNYAFVGVYEMQYLNIPPKIIAEEYLENAGGDLWDYKVFCFNGKAYSIEYITDRKTDKRLAFFDRDWKKQPYITNGTRLEEEVPRPSCLEEMLALAEKLSVGFCMVRVDFYVLNDGSIKFGEMTFTPGNGALRWSDPEAHRAYGDMLQLPPKSPIPTREA